MKTIKKLTLVFGITLVLFALLTTCLLAPKRYWGNMETINFRAVVGGSALVYIAQERHFFAENGLDVKIKNYETGMASGDALLRGEEDIVWLSEFQVVRRSFEKQNVAALASVNRFEDQHLLAHRSKGIGSISDLAGKKIGLARNSIFEFYLTRFFSLNGMNLNAVTIVDVQFPQAAEHLMNGSIDSIIAWTPYTSEITTRLGDEVVNWSIQSSQPGYGVILARKDWVLSKSDVVKRFLRSLAQAEDYLVKNPDASKSIVQKRLNLDGAAIDQLWSEVRFFLSLDQSLVLAMEDQARWMISKRLTAAKKMPNFVDYIYENGLRAVKPEAVNIIR